MNVNVPDRPADQLRGLHAARLAPYGVARAIIGEPGEGFIPITFSQLEAQPGDATDLVLLREGWATVTLVEGLSESSALDLSTLG